LPALECQRHEKGPASKRWASPMTSDRRITAGCRGLLHVNRWQQVDAVNG
jgi:hypothetical protein